MNKIVDKINEYAKDGKISCTDALKIAEMLNVSPGKVGKALNEQKIKIKGCQLGCF
jgi:hypothetical protein